MITLDSRATGREDRLWGSEVDQTMSDKKDMVQTRNPRTGHYVKVDKARGVIVAHKKTPGPYKGIAIATKRRE